jgi:phage-related protein
MSIAAIASAGSKAFTALSYGSKKMATETVKAVNQQVGVMASFNQVLESALEPLTLITEPLTAIGEVIASSLYPAIQPLSDALYSLIPVIEPIIQQVGAQLTPIMESLAPVITQLVPPLVEMGAVIITALLPSVVSILNAFLPLTPAVVALFNAFSPLLPIIVMFMNPLAGFATKMELLTPLIEQTVPYIVAFANATGVLIQGLANVVQWFIDLPSKIVDALTSADIRTKIKNWWDDLLDW